ncbi:MICOS complex subunit Mic10 [Helicoverpa armigera]|uniref:MICOS complex subunit Mic10 n=1 Tax=Helicoverpa armigera TaxID=29058 RepID=UPI000B37DA3F|nr:MICOS complex subunit Mic10-like [Helicoverpa zea]PZC79379.1 hypothetical protein B5X24_HaOG216374 [Helicoverpa armigera]
MAKDPAAAKSPEDEYRRKLDMCITDTIVKGGGGVLLGSLVSMLLIKRRWPITTGLGVGMGIAFANCQFALNPEKDGL